MPSTSAKTPPGQFKVDLAPGEKPPKGMVRGRTIVLVTFAVILAFLAVDLVSAFRNRDEARQSDADAEVMADPARVTRSWTATADGIVERNLAADPADVAAVRRKVAEMLITRRNIGDYSVEGQKVAPGRSDLESALDDIKVTRRDVQGGAELVFASAEPDLVAALHDWGAFQQELTAG